MYMDRAWKLQANSLDGLRDACLLARIPARVHAALVDRLLRGDLLLRLFVLLQLLDMRILVDLSFAPRMARVSERGPSSST